MSDSAGEVVVAAASAAGLKLSELQRKLADASSGAGERGDTAAATVAASSGSPAAAPAASAQLADV